MNLHIAETPQASGKAAAKEAERLILQSIREKDHANIILATGASQFAMLETLTQFTSIDWYKVRMFHLDEYINLPESHPASFRKYLKERFVDKVEYLGVANLIDGNHQPPEEECQRLGQLIREHPIDVALIGIGENGHLAFNDPPADFETSEPFIVVELDEACRQQQVGEGWFDNLEVVPKKAISMSIQQILKSKHLIVSVPDQRKAEAVKNAVNGPITPQCPASILQSHPNCSLHLDQNSASLLSISN